MMAPTTVSESFIKWMEDNGYGTFGADIFLNLIPDDAQDNAFWVITAGGDVSSKNVSAESVQKFSTQIFYRNQLSVEVEHMMFKLNQKVNTRGSFDIDGFDLYNIEATMPQDNDRDAESRHSASILVEIEIYVDYIS